MVTYGVYRLLGSLVQSPRFAQEEIFCPSIQKRTMTGVTGYVEWPVHIDVCDVTPVTRLYNLLGPISLVGGAAYFFWFLCLRKFFKNPKKTKNFENFEFSFFSIFSKLLYLHM